MSISGKLRGAGGGSAHITSAVLLANNDSQASLMSYGSGWWTDNGENLYTTQWSAERSNHFESDLDVTALTYRSYYIWNNEDVVGIVVNATGTIVIIFDSNRAIRQFSTSTDYRLSSMSVTTTLSGSIKNSAGSNYTMYGGTLSRDGQYLYTMQSGIAGIRRYTLATPFVLSSIVSTLPDAGQEVNVSADPTLVGFPFGLSISHDGQWLHVADRNTKALYQWKLNTPYDLSTIEWVGEFVDAVNMASVAGVASHPTDARFVYVLGQATGISKWRVT